MAKLSPEVEQFFSSAQRDVDAALRSIIAPPGGSAIANLDDGLAYSLALDDPAANAGKRIRPLLCLLVCHTLCGQCAPALPFATAIELMHNFCLVHDDIEDGDEVRRGRPAVWKKYGLAHGINIGDYIFTKVFAALLMNREQYPPERIVRFFELMSTTLDHTHRGQALDINARFAEITVNDYMALVTEKTGHYLAAPLLAGAIAAGADAEVEATLRAFGLAIGPMFQIKDDLIDLTHGKGRDIVGSDIREGKRSYLVAFACERADPTTKEELLRMLDLPREKTEQKHVDRAIDIFEQCGCFYEARQACEDLRKQALTHLEKLPQPLGRYLHEITDYLAERTA